MPLLSPEKGQQVTYIVASVLLLVSGIYYSVEVLPEWMQWLAQVFAGLLRAERHPGHAARWRPAQQPVGEHLAVADHGRRLPAARALALQARRALRQDGPAD